MAGNKKTFHHVYKSCGISLVYMVFKWALIQENRALGTCKKVTLLDLFWIFILISVLSQKFQGRASAIFLLWKLVMSKFSQCPHLLIIVAGVDSGTILCLMWIWSIAVSPRQDLANMLTCIRGNACFWLVDMILEVQVLMWRQDV